MGHSAAGSAASAEQQALSQAEAYQKQQSQNAVNQQQQTTGQITGELNPFLQTGQQATQSLSSLLAPGGQLTQGWNQQFQAPTAEQAAQTPGYQFQLQQGLNALQNSAAARGGLLSTGTAKNLNNYAQGVASSNYDDRYQQAFNTYNTNQSTFRNNQADLYNRLSGTAGQGLSAGATLGSLQQQGAQGLSNTYLQSGQQIGNDITQGGQAQAAGIVGGSNALASGLGGALNTVGQGVTLAGLLGQGTMPPPSNVGNVWENG